MSILTQAELAGWETRLRKFINAQPASPDPAHDLSHILRVVENSRRLAAAEGGRLDIVIPAAWLHDCVLFPKNDGRRSQASRLAAAKAVQLLESAGYPSNLIPAIAHAIEAHSFSAGIPPRSLEARVVQDADRLDSLGAIGIARCLLTGVSFDTLLYDPADPFAENRPLDDKSFSIDHFYVKLLRLADQMQTPAGRREARQRTAFMSEFLNQLKAEIEPPAR